MPRPINRARDKEIAELDAEGYSIRQIAAILDCGLATVHRSLKRTREQTDVAAEWVKLISE